MTKDRKKGSRVTPRGTQDPNARKDVGGPDTMVPRLDRERIRGIHKGVPATLDDFEKEYGIRPKALPGSGFCMSCGNKLVGPPEGKDLDHAVCHNCFPEDLREEWEGKQVDFARYNLDEGTLEEVTMPPDPFGGEVSLGVEEAKGNE